MMSNAFSWRQLQRISVFLAAVAGLFSCQTETPTNSDPGGAFQVRQQWSIEPERYPDSVAWAKADTRGVFSLERIDAKVFEVSASFPRSIALDSLDVELWTLGIRTSVVHVKVTAKGELEVNKAIREVDDGAVSLLKGFDSARSKSNAYGSSSDPIQTQKLAFQRYLAIRILAGSYSIASLPHGTDSLAVVAKVLLQGTLDGKSVVKIAGATQLDLAQLRIRAELLIRSGELEHSDSLILFPPDPIRTAQPLAVGTSVEAGGATVPVRGSFAWTRGVKVGNPQYQVRSSTGRSEDFNFQVQQLPGGSDTSWNLEGIFSIQAKNSAVAGIDTLFVTLQDDSGHSATASAVFTVLARDTTTPVVGIVRPTRDSSVSNGVKEIELEVLATDPVGIASIQVGSQSCQGSPCVVSVSLAVGENTILVDAWDKVGNHLATPLRRTVTRANDPGDTIPPRIERTSPAGQRIVVDYSTKTFSLAYKVTDDSLDLVSLNGRILTGASGVFQAMVDLDIGTDTLVLQALDKRGNPARDTVWVTRAKDTSKPNLKMVSPATDTQVAFSTTSLRVLVSADDPAGIDSVLVGGVRSESSTSPYAVIVSLAPGRNTVVIEAVDTYGNRSAKEIGVVREAAFDSVAPKIEKLGPRADTSVTSTTSSIKLSWKVTDDSAVSQVSLNGTKLVVGTDGLYSTTQTLTVGPNVFVLEAKDARGNTRLDTLKVSRLADATGPKIVYKGGAKDSAVWAYVPSLVVSWGVTDDALKSVSINGALVAGASGVFSTTVSLTTDTTMVRLIAIDEAGNIAMDSVRVVRKYDKTAPVVAFQKTKVRLVANAVTADTLVWNVSDNLKLKSVTVDGNTVSLANGQYTYIVASLPVGTRNHILLATDSAGNVTKDTAVVARTALAPTHSAPAGNYIGTVYDTLKSEGADSILYSFSLSGVWQKMNGRVMITSTGTLYAKAFPGEQISTTTYKVSQVTTVASAGSIWISSAYSLFVLQDGSVWGAGSEFGVFSGAYSGGRIDTAVKLPHSALDVVVGDWNAFYLQSDNRWYGAGMNGEGQLGIGYVDNTSPLGVVKLDGIQQLAVGNGATYFRREDGSVWGVGTIAGDIGGSPLPTDGNPIKIEGLAHIADLRVGNLQSSSTFTVAAVDSSGRLFVWGSDNPTPLEVLTGVRSVAFANTLTALMKDGTVQCMGDNANGQVGNGTTRETGFQFSQSIGLSSIVSVSTGRFTNMFLKQDGSLYVAGMVPDSILGYTQYTGPIYLTPTKIDSDVDAIWSASDINFYRKKDGTLWAMGSGFFGDGLYGSTGTPRRINF